MSEAIDTLNPADTRYHIKNAKELSVVMRTEDSGARNSIQAELIHISPIDASLRIRSPIEAKDIVGLSLVAKHPERTITVSGEICWMVPGNSKCWWVGCSFDPPIPKETLEHFAEGGILDRREHTRRKVALSTEAKWALDSDGVNGEIVDFSQGGFCLQSPTAGKPGERLLLQLSSRDARVLRLQAKAQWQVESDGHYIVGCQFVDPEDYRIFAEARDLDDLTVAGAFSVWRWLGGAFGGARPTE